MAKLRVKPWQEFIKEDWDVDGEIILPTGKEYPVSYHGLNVLRKMLRKICLTEMWREPATNMSKDLHDNV